MVSFSAIPKWRSLEISNYGLLRNFLENRYCSVTANPLPCFGLIPSRCLGGFRREIRLIFNATRVVLYRDEDGIPDEETIGYALYVRDEFRCEGSPFDAR